jgi:HEAT repeats
MGQRSCEVDRLWLKVQRGCVTALGIVVSLCLPLMAAQQPVNPAPQVRWHAGVLSVRVERVPLDVVLNLITGQTKLRVISAVSLHRLVTAKFDGLSLHEALERLLVQENYATMEKSGASGAAQPMTVVILGQVRTSPSPVAEPAPLVGEQNDDSSGRLNRLLAAIGSGGPEANEAVLEAAGDPDPNISTIALQSLVEWDPQAAHPALEEAVHSRNTATRFAALQEVQETGQPETLSTLSDALQDKDNDVKGYALQMLLQDGSPAAMEALAQCLHDPDPNFRELVQSALATHSEGGSVR